MPDVLHAQVVLVGVEVRQPVIDARTIEDAEPGKASRPDRVVPVLDTEPVAQQRIASVGDVPGGPHVRIGGSQPFVDEDAVVDDQAGLLGQAGIRDGADPYQHDICRQYLAVHPDAGDHAVATLEPVDADPGAQIDPVVDVQPREVLGDRLPEHVEQR